MQLKAESTTKIKKKKKRSLRLVEMHPGLTFLYKNLANLSIVGLYQRFFINYFINDLSISG